MTVEGTALREVLRAYASGVAIATAPGPAGVTVTSFTSISAEPALVSFALAETSSTWPAIRESDRFAIHVLGGDQGDLARRFAARGVDRFAPPTRWSAGAHGVPLIEGSLARLICSRHALTRLGDHHLVVGAVEHAETGQSGPGLVHLHGALHPVSPSPRNPS